MTESLLATIDDAAAALAVSPRTIRNLIQRGDLAPVRIGRSVRIPIATLRAFVDARVADAAPPTEMERGA